MRRELVYSRENLASLLVSRGLEMKVCRLVEFLDKRLVLFGRCGRLVLAGVLGRHHRQTKHKNKDTHTNAVHGIVLRLKTRFGTTDKYVHFTATLSARDLAPR